MKCTGPILKSALTYTLGRSLYVPLTSRSNTVSLPETRGPGFKLPAETVASLCRVRAMEQDGRHEDMSHGYHQSLERLHLPPPLERVSHLEAVDNNDGENEEDGRYPLVATLKEEIDQRIKDSLPDALVIAGEGEPTLRRQAVLSIARTYRSKVPVIRLVTNGLLVSSFSPDSFTKELTQSGVNSVSVALMTADPVQYEGLMQPVVLEDNNVVPSSSAHEQVCEFIRQAVHCELNVEITGVDRPDVDKAKTEELAASLGVTLPFRWRPFFKG